jgi:hypothetical protein
MKKEAKQNETDKRVAERREQESGQKELEAGQVEFEPGQSELEAGHRELKAGNTGLIAGQSEQDTEGSLTICRLDGERHGHRAEGQLKEDDIETSKSEEWGHEVMRREVRSENGWGKHGLHHASDRHRQKDDWHQPKFRDETGQIGIRSQRPSESQVDVPRLSARQKRV